MINEINKKYQCAYEFSLSKNLYIFYKLKENE